MTTKKMTEDCGKCRANTLHLVLPASSTDKNYVPVFTEKQWYRKINQNKKDVKNLLQTSDMLYASTFNIIETTDSSIYIKETSWKKNLYQLNSPNRPSKIQLHWGQASNHTDLCKWLAVLFIYILIRNVIEQMN